MIWFAARKFAAFVATVLVAAAIVYVFAPGGNGFLAWLGGTLVGDFGRSLGQEAVGGLIGGALSVSVPLIVVAALLTAAIGTGVGALAARRPGSLADKGLQALIEIGVAVPNFWLGMLLALLFSAMPHWLPSGGFVPWSQNPAAAFASLLLPALALALPQAAVLARAVRTALADAKASTYLKAAEGHGLTAREALRRHGLRNAAAVVVRGLGRQLAMLIAGAVIVENVFYLPGLGRLILDGIVTRDMAVVRSGVFVLVLVIAGTAFLMQLCIAWTDPRLRERSAA